jgi:hypothetical protein
MANVANARICYRGSINRATKYVCHGHLGNNFANYAHHHSYNMAQCNDSFGIALNAIDFALAGDDSTNSQLVAHNEIPHTQGAQLHLE